MKKFLFCYFIIFLVTFMFIFLPAHSNSEINVYLNGHPLTFDVSPVNIDGRILVPFRGILESLGAEVSYTDGADVGTSYAIAMGKTAGKALLIPIGQNFITINSCTFTINIPAQIIKGRTLVPIRVVSECMGANVEWDNTTKTVTITTYSENSIKWNDEYTYFGDTVSVNNSLAANGYGTIYNNKDGKILCKGYFENNFILNGQFYYPDSYTYIGEFSDTEFGHRNGTGTTFYEDGSFIDGSWSNNVQNGDFILYLSDSNTRITGKSIYGNWDGEITLYFLDDKTTKTCIYKNGEKMTSPQK